MSRQSSRTLIMSLPCSMNVKQAASPRQRETFNLPSSAEGGGPPAGKQVVEDKPIRRGIK